MSYLSPAVRRPTAPPATAPKMPFATPTTTPQSAYGQGRFMGAPSIPGTDGKKKRAYGGPQRSAGPNPMPTPWPQPGQMPGQMPWQMPWQQPQGGFFTRTQRAMSPFESREARQITLPYQQSQMSQMPGGMMMPFGGSPPNGGLTPYGGVAAWQHMQRMQPMPQHNQYVPF